LRLFKAKHCLKIVFGCRGKQRHFGHPITCRSFEKFPYELSSDPLPLILGAHGGGTKEGKFSVSLQPHTTQNLALAVPRNKKSAKVFLHSVVREIFPRKNLKHFLQTSGSSSFDGDQSSDHFNARC